MNEQNPRAKFLELVHALTKNYIADMRTNIYDPEEQRYPRLRDPSSSVTQTTIDPEKYLPVSTTLLLLNSLLGKNTLYEGGRGTGKTTSLGVVGSVLHQLPFDYFLTQRVVGVPGLTINRYLATQDIAAVNRGEDKAYLFLPFHAPYLIIDEINRFTGVEQNVLREGIATDVWKYGGNHAWPIDGQVVVSAMNPDAYGGTYPFNENLADNFAIALVPPRVNELVHQNLILSADGNIRRDLGNAKSARELLQTYRDNNCNPDKIKAAILKMQEETVQEYRRRGIPFIHNGTIPAIKAEIQEKKLDIDAQLFVLALRAEMQYNNQYGELRREDPQGDDHDMAYLGGQMQEGLSGRFIKDYLETAKGLTWVMNKSTVGIDELRAAFMYAAPHRMIPREDFKQECLNDPRGVPFKIKMAMKAVQGVASRYSDYQKADQSFNTVREVVKNLGRGENTNEAINALQKHDHPIAQLLLEAIVAEELD